MLPRKYDPKLLQPGLYSSNLTSAQLGREAGTAYEPHNPTDAVSTTLAARSAVYLCGHGQKLDAYSSKPAGPTPKLRAPAPAARLENPHKTRSPPAVAFYGRSLPLRWTTSPCASTSGKPTSASYVVDVAVHKDFCKVFPFVNWQDIVDITIGTN